MNPSLTNGQVGGKTDAHSDLEQESAKVDNVSEQITLDLVVRTAFALQKLQAGTNCEDNDKSEDVYVGQEAIELLFVWALQLESEKKTGHALKRAEEMVSRWQAEREEQQQHDEEFNSLLELKSQERAAFEQIATSDPLPFKEVARRIAPKNRDAINWLERILTVLARSQKMAEHEPLRAIAQRALTEKSVPKDLIPYLSEWLPYCRESYLRRMAKQKGRKGGLKRAENQAHKKTSTKREVRRERKRLGKEVDRAFEL